MDRDTKIETCARVAHEANRAYCISIGDLSQREWTLAAEWQKESARKGVVGVIDYGNTPGDSHRSWLKEKSETGWVYGPEKDEDKKEHPCMVPFTELPPDQQVKDYIFVKTVRAMWDALSSFDHMPLTDA